MTSGRRESAKRKKEEQKEALMTRVLASVFGRLGVGSAVRVVTSANPVQAVLNLVRVFCQAAGLRLVREVEFRGLLLLVVYVGAIAVLFLFVVRRLNVQPRRRSRNERRRTLPRAGVRGGLVLSERYRVHASWVPGRGSRFGGEEAPRVWVETRDGRTNLEARGAVLYTEWGAYFLIASLVLLVARLGTIVLTVQRAVGDEVPAARQVRHDQLARDRDRAVVRFRKEGTPRRSRGQGRGGKHPEDRGA